MSGEVGKQFIDPQIKAIYFFTLLKCVVKNSIFFLSPQSVCETAPAVYLLHPRSDFSMSYFAMWWMLSTAGGRKMARVWAVTVYPQGGLRARGKLHLPRSCVCKKFPQSHSQRKFTSESTSALHKARHSRQFHLDINLLSLPHGTSLFFPALSIKVICKLTHILISAPLETNAVPFYSPPFFCWDDVICFPKQQDTLFKITIKLKRDEQSGVSGSSRAACCLKSTHQRR